jgi:hypothetical protein
MVGALHSLFRTHSAVDDAVKAVSKVLNVGNFVEFLESRPDWRPRRSHLWLRPAAGLAIPLHSAVPYIPFPPLLPLLFPL